jgi:hypothetical protein
MAEFTVFYLIEMLGLIASGTQKVTAFVFTRRRQALRFHLAPFRNSAR